MSYEGDLIEDIKHQLEYYLSDESLPYDHLTLNEMDDCDWLPLSFLKTAPRIKHLLRNLYDEKSKYRLLIRALRTSNKLDLEEYKCEYFVKRKRPLPISLQRIADETYKYGKDKSVYEIKHYLNSREYESNNQGYGNRPNRQRRPYERRCTSSTTAFNNNQGRGRDLNNRPYSIDNRQRISSGYEGSSKYESNDRYGIPRRRFRSETRPPLYSNQDRGRDLNRNNSGTLRRSNSYGR